MWSKTFQEAFCEKAGCQSEAFEKQVFRRCLRRSRRPLSALVYLLNPQLFKLDFRTIERLGDTKSLRDFRFELERFREERLKMGFFRRTLCVGVSDERLLDLLLFLQDDVPVGGGQQGVRDYGSGMVLVKTRL